MDYLHFLETSHDGFYILHEKTLTTFISLWRDTKVNNMTKNRIFTLLSAFVILALSGFQKSIPAVKYYQPLQLDNINEKNKKTTL